MEKDEFENIRGELLRTSGLTEAEVSSELQFEEELLSHIEG